MRAATHADVPAIRKVLAEAFENDPLFTWIFPDDQHRIHQTAAWLGLFAEAYITSGRIDVVERDGEIAAAALWRMPGDEPVIELPGVTELVAAFIGTERTNAIFENLGALAAGHATEPYAYLHLLAVSPRHQRQGLGRTVIAGGIAAAEAAGVNAELATMKEANLAFYRSLGFEITLDLVLQPDGPPSWVLRRVSS